MSLDLAIEGGVVVDGTGGQSQRADVGVRDGRVVAVVPPGRLEEQADRHIDASGMVVSPGFIDVHTHLDAQVFWDAACTPVVQHGVTTAIAGNCGFSVAPLVASEVDYLMHMLSKVEEIPLGALESAVDWNWSSMGDYLDRVEQVRPVINLGFMVGHSAMRRVVMGSDAVGEKASSEQVAQMAALLEESLRAGGLGLSSSWHKAHVDGAGDPVPSRWASRDEVVELCRIVSKQPGTSVEFIPGTGGSFEGAPIDSATSGSTESTRDTMIAMSLAAQRPLNWNTFHADALHEAETLNRLAAADAAAAQGARVLALMYPGVMYLRHKLMSDRWAKVPGWAALLEAPETEQVRVLADPAQRAALIAQALVPRADGNVRSAAQWDDVVVNDCYADVNRRYEGRRLGDLAAELGRGSLDLACEIAVADGMQTGFRRAHIAFDDASWKLRVKTWSDPRVVLGASDAGAHVNSISTFDWATAFLELSRTWEAMSLEAAVHRITAVQADLYGLVDRGRIAEGFRADLVVFDADEIGPGQTRLRDDVPGGASRLYSTATGIAHVIVNGVEVARAGEPTGEQPGTVLRSGRDTKRTEL